MQLSLESAMGRYLRTYQPHIAGQGNKVWMWEHQVYGNGTWTQYYPNGKKKFESAWWDFRGEAYAKRRDFGGVLISQARFTKGRLH